MAHDPNDLTEIQSALNGRANKASTLWTTFITFQLYLVIAFGSVTHRDLFLETPIKLPLLGVTLPLVVFFAVAPMLLAIFHFYILLQIAGLASTAASYDAVLSHELPVFSDRQRFRHRLDSFVVLQFLVGPKRSKVGVIELSLKLITWLTLVAAPAAVILFAQVTFLPFHLQWLEWVHRAIFIIDIAISWIFWRRIRSTDAFVGHTTVLRIMAPVSGVTALIAFSTCVATYPGEWIDDYFPSVAIIPTSLSPSWRKESDWTSLHALLFVGRADEVTGRPESVLANRLILTNQDLVDPHKIDSQGNSRRFRGRDLREAIFVGADLRKVDFTGSSLLDADFSRAKLQQASFGCASVGIKDDSPLGFGLDKELCSDLRGARFDNADLSGASFQNVKLQGATFRGSELYGATFWIVKAQGASFNLAELVGAHLDGSFVAASFFMANLTGADLSGGDFTAARFDRSHLVGASIGNWSRFDATYFSEVDAYRLYAGDDNYEVKKVYLDSFHLNPILWVGYHGYSDAKEFVSAVASAIQADDKVKASVQTRINWLSLAGTPESLALIKDRSNQAVAKIKSAAIPLSDYRKEFPDQLFFELCNSDSPQYVVRGMLRSGILTAVEANIPRLVEELTTDWQTEGDFACYGVLSDQLISKIASLSVGE